MKGTLRLLSAALFLTIATPSYAEDSPKPDTTKSSAKQQTTKRTVTIGAGESAEVPLGAKFKTMRIKVDAKLDYKIKRGSEFLSSGHTTGSNFIGLEQDGVVAHTLVLTNPGKEPIVANVEIIIAARK